MADETNYDNINCSFSKYCGLLGKPNVETELQTLREKILISVCKIFYLDENGFSIRSDEKNHQKKKENQEYSDEIVSKTLECLKYVCKQENPAEKDFAKYVISSVKKRLNFLKSHDAIKESNSSLEIPRDKIDLIRKIKKENQNLRFIKNENAKLERIRLNLGISGNDFKILWPLANGQKISLDKPLDSKKSENDKKSLGETQKSPFVSGEKLLEQKEKLNKIFELIEKEWKKNGDSDGSLSDALTADILKNLFAPDSKFDNEDLPAFENYSFFNQEIVHNFFADISYNLPTQTEIGEKHGGKGKSAISKSLKRFYEKLQQPIRDSGILD